jgi:hypothetical protein
MPTLQPAPAPKPTSTRGRYHLALLEAVAAIDRASALAPPEKKPILTTATDLLDKSFLP